MPREPLRSSTGPDGCVYGTFGSFWQTNECNEFGGLFLMSLDEMEKEKKDEFRDSNSQLQYHTHENSD